MGAGPPLTVPPDARAPRRELILGASGLVGSHLLRAAGPGAVGTFHRQAREGLRPLDLADDAAVDRLLEETAPEIVYLPAARPDVDRIETHPDESRAVNVEAPLRLLPRLRSAGARLVYFSSDYVFDGTSGPYGEDDPPRPINEYGRQKLAVERAIADGLDDWLVLRVTVVYGWEPQRKNFGHRSVCRLRAGETVRAPADQVGSPTFAGTIAEAARALALGGEGGLFHVAGNALVSRFDFAREIARVFGADPALVQPVTTEELAQPAARPRRAGMIVDKAASRIPVPLVGYTHGLLRMKAEESEHAPVCG